MKGLGFEPVISLIVNGMRLSVRQLEVLNTVRGTGSQNQAANVLGISPPVLHRYLGQIEAKLGTEVLITTPTGTRLNELGERIAMEYSALNQRLKGRETIVVGGTMITEELLLSSLTKADPEGTYQLIISDDERNLRDFNAGLMDLVLLDDPLNLFDLEHVNWEEIAEDRLIHVDKGDRYARFPYGAQRIGFQHLRSVGTPFKVDRTIRSVPALLSSGLSFFINESLAARKGLRMRSDTDPNVLSHKIFAAYRSADVSKLVRELRMERQEYYDLNR